MIVSLASVTEDSAPFATVGALADFAEVNDDDLLIVVDAVEGPEFVVEPSGFMPVAVAELVTPLETPAALFTSDCDKT